MSSASTLAIPTLTAPNTASVRPRLEGFSDEALNAAFEACREVVRTRARNFYYGLRLTPEPRRSAVYAIYAWMRFGDDRVDSTSSPEARKLELDRFRELSLSVLAGSSLGGPEPFWPAFAATLRSYPIDPAHVTAMIQGLGEDIDHRGYHSLSELEAYCYRVASTVGLVCMSIWGYRAGVTITDLQRGAVMSERRGKAFQLTNILRDFAEDFDQQPSRVYLPRELFDEFNLTPADLRRWQNPAACAALVTKIATIARDHYAASQALDELVDTPCRSTLWAMTRIYSGLLSIILKNPAAIVGPSRIRLPSAGKAWIASSALLRGKFNLWPASTIIHPERTP